MIYLKCGNIWSLGPSLMFRKEDNIISLVIISATVYIKINFSIFFAQDMFFNNAVTLLSLKCINFNILVCYCHDWSILVLKKSQHYSKRHVIDKKKLLFQIIC